MPYIDDVVIAQSRPKPAANMSTLKLVTSAKVNGTIPVYKYESERTGLKIVLAQVEGPLVNGYFTLGNCPSCVGEH